MRQLVYKGDYILDIGSSGAVVWWLSLQNNFIQLSLNSGSDSEDLWQWIWLEIRLNAFCRSTILQKQFIIIIIKYFFNFGKLKFQGNTLDCKDITIA